jgi:sulfate adenylyltransferase subunit 1
MVTGASTANVALILIDARKGVIEQTLRHWYIASLLQIPHLIVCINKMDLVDYKENVYNDIQKQFEAISSKLNIQDVRFVPISALKGDNVVERSTNMDWYEGTTLMYLLENIHIGSDNNFTDGRFPVQYVIRPQSKEYHDFRGFAGRVAGGIFRKDDDVIILPSGFDSKIKSIVGFNEDLDKAYPPQSVTLTLQDEIDISRGDMIVKKNSIPEVSQDIDLMICWFNERPLQIRTKYALKHTTNDVRCMITEIVSKVDINTLNKDFEDKNIKMNDIARIKIRTTKPLIFDSYNKNRITGSVILIDEATNETIAAGFIM